MDTSLQEYSLLELIVTSLETDAHIKEKTLKDTISIFYDELEPDKQEYNEQEYDKYLENIKKIIKQKNDAFITLSGSLEYDYPFEDNMDYLYKILDNEFNKDPEINIAFQEPFKKALKKIGHDTYFILFIKVWIIMFKFHNLGKLTSSIIRYIVLQLQVLTSEQQYYGGPQYEKSNHKKYWDKIKSKLKDDGEIIYDNDSDDYNEENNINMLAESDLIGMLVCPNACLEEKDIQEEYYRRI